MESIFGIGSLGRRRLVEVLRKSKGTISIHQVSDVLDIHPTVAAKMLSRWAKKGWIRRVKWGLYIPVPLESPTADVPFEDPWIVANAVYSPCYIGGWSAGEYWDLTEQIFTTTVVLTTNHPRNRKQTLLGTSFQIRNVSSKAFFGLKTTWRGQLKVSVSDPTRTIIDLMNDVRLGGGLVQTNDMLQNYLKSSHIDLSLLLEYGDRLGNGAVFKRLGFLLERLIPNERRTLNALRGRITQGNAKLDPTISSVRLATKWKLWIPKSWRLGMTFD